MRRDAETQSRRSAAIAAAKVEPVHLLIEGDLESGFKIIGPFSDAQSGLAYRKANDLKAGMDYHHTGCICSSAGIVRVDHEPA